MPTVTLGKTGITVDKNGFGALPIQRASIDDAVLILRKALDNGITFFDTARGYSNSEEKLGIAFEGKRDQVILATKTPAKNAQDFWKDLETSLRLLKTDYVDILQFHNPVFCPKPEDGSGLYEAITEAKAQGKVRFAGVTNHRFAVAKETVESGLYEMLQFPLSYLSSAEDEELIALCKQKQYGFLAMKALSGGLITNAAAAYAYMSQFENVLPIWGIQRETELDDFIRFRETPPQMTEDMIAEIAKDRRQLSGSFCRGCGYCLPCPVNIEINMCARISLMLRRAPSASWLTESWQTKMQKIENCLECGRCTQHCPYHLDIPALLKVNLADYQNVLAGRTKV